VIATSKTLQDHRCAPPGSIPGPDQWRGP